MDNNRLLKQERLSGRKRIGTLFSDGSSGFSYPFRYVFVISDDESCGGVSLLVSVPKKNHKRAVKRNKVKRRTREAFRLAKSDVSGMAAEDGKRVDMALIYVSKEIEEYRTIENAVGKILAEIAGHI